MANNTNAYIKTSAGNISLVEGSRCSLNFGIADIRDVGSRGGTFSKQLVAVWDDDNHRIFGQLFDINGTDFDFDPNQRVECEVIQNGLTIVDSAFLQLIEINEEQHTSQTQQIGSYSILVKSAQRDLFTKMGAQELTDLDFTYLNHTYNAANVVSSFTHTSADGYVYPMAINDDNNFLLTDFRPAIYVNEYFKQIHATNGFSFEVRDFPTFDKLVIPFASDTPAIDNTDFLVEATKSSFASDLGTIAGVTEIADNESLFNPTTGVYDVPVYLTGGQAININVSIDCDFVLDNTSGADAYLVDITNSGFDRSVRYKGFFRVYKNGTLYNSGNFIGPNSFGNNQGVEFFESDTPIASGDTIIYSDNSEVNIPVGNVLPTDTLTFEIDSSVTTGNISPPFMVWKDAVSSTANNVTVNTRIDINDVTVRAELTANSIGFGFEQDMNNFVPPKIKQKDFVKAVCNMAQLWAYPDEDNPNKIIYQPRDEYLDDGERKNWTHKLAKDKNQLQKFLSNTQKKRKIFTYKEDKDVYNVQFKDATNEVYGQAEFIFDTEFRQDVDKLELLFSPTPMTEISIGAVVPTFVGTAPNNNIRILIHNGTAICNSYNIFDYATTGQTGLTDYPIVSHFDDPYNPTVDINFAVCDYYYYQGVTLTNNNLFNLYWRRTMAQLNKGKMLTAMFDLSVADIADLKLNDTIYVRNAYWYINKVIDYDANGNSLTKVELLSADDERPPFRIKPFVPSIPSGTDNPIKGLIDDLYVHNNVNFSDGSVSIKGKGNVINQNVKAIVIGKDGVIQEDGYYLNGEKVGEASDEIVNNLKSSVNIDSDYTIDPTAADVFYLVRPSLTITLPDADTYTNRRIYIKDVNQGSQTITVAAGNIDTQTSVNLTNNDSLTLHAKGGKWNIL